MGASAAVTGAVFFAIAIAVEFELATFTALGAAAGASMAAFLLRDRSAPRRASYLKSAFAAAAYTGILTGLASFALPDHYVSTGILRTARVDASGLPVSGADPEHLQRVNVKVLSRNALAELIQRPALDLYRRERQRRPLEEIVQEMRRSIRVYPANVSRSAFAISYEYPDRYKAQAVVRELMAKFLEANVAAQVNAPGRPGGIAMEVLDPASPPSTASSPNRAQIACAGFVAGLPLGLLIAFLRRRLPGQDAPMVHYAGSGGAA